MIASAGLAAGEVALVPAARDAVAAGVPVVVTSRCPSALV